MTSWWLILKAGSGQEHEGRSHFGRPLNMSKYRFVKVRISIHTSKIISGTQRPLEVSQARYRQGGNIQVRLHVRLNICLLQSRFQFLHQKNNWHLEDSQVQIGKSYLGIPSRLSKYRFVGVRISILTSKIISGPQRPLKADPPQGQILFLM